MKCVGVEEGEGLGVAGTVSWGMGIRGRRNLTFGGKLEGGRGGVVLGRGEWLLGGCCWRLGGGGWCGWLGGGSIFAVGVRWGW